ncbi:hypothetical protein ACFFRR_008094 [Megaselia abdita]
MQRENPEFIKYVSMPFSMELCHIPACILYKQVKVHDMVYFDASGRTCGHPNIELNKKRIKDNQTPLRQNQVLFYTTIAEKNESLLPLHMIVTEDHSAHNIGYHLKNFKIECVKSKIWPIFRKVIIDFSSALNIALNFAYNDFPMNATTDSYLKFCFEIISKQIVLPKWFIVVQGCCAHLAKIISFDLERFHPGINKKTKHIIQESMAFATTTSDLEIQGKWWKYFCIIFGSKKYTPEVSEAITKMFSLINYNESETNTEKESMDNSKKNTAVYHDEKIIYKNSPFFQHFKEISDKLKTTMDKDAPTDNEHYIEGLIDHYLQKYMYNICFWSNSMGCLIESGGKLNNIKQNIKNLLSSVQLASIS